MKNLYKIVFGCIIYFIVSFFTQRDLEIKMRIASVFLWIGFYLMITYAIEWIKKVFFKQTS